jgi:hypothetical protein
MNGHDCPQCGRPTEWGSTDNEWEYVCRPCDARFNAEGEKMPPFAELRDIRPKNWAEYEGWARINGHFNAAVARLVGRG